MNNTITISKVNSKVIDYIKRGIADKKEMHRKVMKSIDPQVVQTLKSMKKIDG